jgi:hypothetical protein
MRNKDTYGREYPYIPWRRQYRRQINAMILSLATIIIFMSVLCLSISLLPDAIDKEISRQVAVVESALGGNSK